MNTKRLSLAVDQRARRFVTISKRCAPTSPSGAASARPIRSTSGSPRSTTNWPTPIRSNELQLVQERRDLQTKWSRWAAPSTCRRSRARSSRSPRPTASARASPTRPGARSASRPRAQAGRHRPLGVAERDVGVTFVAGRRRSQRVERVAHPVEVAQRALEIERLVERRPRRASPRDRPRATSGNRVRSSHAAWHCLARSGRRRRGSARLRPAPAAPAG